MTNNQSVPTIETLKEIKDFFQQRGNLQRFCDEIEFEYKTLYGRINGEISKLSILQAIVMSEWMIMWNKQAKERLVLKKLRDENVR